MPTKADFTRFVSAIHALPSELLCDAVSGYAEMDFEFWMHFEALLAVLAGEPEAALLQVRKRIEAVYGDNSISHQLKFEERTRFNHVGYLVRMLHDRGMHLEAVNACEYAFTFAEYTAAVTWPDDFTDLCYDDLISTWIKSSRALNLTAAEIVKRLLLLKTYDHYCILASLEQRFESELGEEILAELRLRAFEQNTR